MRGSAATPAVSHHDDSPDARSLERLLVERARTDRQAFAQLYRMHIDAVFRFAFRRCGSREVAEEATSATFERALRAISSYEWQPPGMLPWLYRIASNEVANVYRRRSAADSARGQRAMRDLATAETDMSADALGTDLVELHAALNALPERYREVITARYLSDLSADEAAAALGCSKPVLAVTLHRALAALRKRLAALDAEENR